MEPLFPLPLHARPMDPIGVIGVCIDLQPQVHRCIGAQEKSDSASSFSKIQFQFLLNLKQEDFGKVQEKGKVKSACEKKESLNFKLTFCVSKFFFGGGGLGVRSNLKSCSLNSVGFHAPPNLREDSGVAINELDLGR